jgi:hypothetical protein
LAHLQLGAKGGRRDCILEIEGPICIQGERLAATKEMTRHVSAASAPPRPPHVARQGPLPSAQCRRGTVFEAKTSSESGSRRSEQYCGLARILKMPGLLESSFILTPGNTAAIAVAPAILATVESPRRLLGNWVSTRRACGTRRPAPLWSTSPVSLRKPSRNARPRHENAARRHDRGRRSAAMSTVAPMSMNSNTLSRSVFEGRRCDC